MNKIVPIELWVKICSLLDPVNMASMEKTCRIVYIACKKQLIWKSISEKAGINIIAKKPNYKKEVIKKIKFLCSCNVITLKSNLFYTVDAKIFGLNNLYCESCFITAFQKYSKSTQIMYEFTKYINQKESLQILFIPPEMLKNLCDYKVKSIGHGKYVHLYNDSDIEQVHDFIYGEKNIYSLERKNQALIQLQKNRMNCVIKELKLLHKKKGKKVVIKYKK
jgi:uncharacterized protein (DUF952 family)